MSENQAGGIPLTQNRVTIPMLQRMKKEGKTIAASSIYNAEMASMFDEAGGDIIVVGDSASMTQIGRPGTVPATMEEMLFFTKMVMGGTKRPFVIADMPFCSYEVSDEQALTNAGRLLKESGDRPPHAVKMEINRYYVRRVEFVAKACLVVPHIGLNPNKAEFFGGYQTQGKDLSGAKDLIETALAAEEAGACMILIESVPEEVSQAIKALLKIPVLGIAAGRNLDGQLLISSDILGFYKWEGTKNIPRHFKMFRASREGLTGRECIVDLFSSYVREVKDKVFPGEENSHFLPEKDRDSVLKYLQTLRSAKTKSESVPESSNLAWATQ